MRVISAVSESEGKVEVWLEKKKYIWCLEWKLFATLGVPWELTGADGPVARNSPSTRAPRFIASGWQVFSCSFPVWPLCQLCFGNFLWLFLLSGTSHTRTLPSWSTLFTFQGLTQGAPFWIWLPSDYPENCEWFLAERPRQLPDMLQCRQQPFSLTKDFMLSTLLCQHFFFYRNSEKHFINHDKMSSIQSWSFFVCYLSINTYQWRHNLK